MRRRKALPTIAGFLVALMSPAQTVHGTATDRIIALIEEARSSACFLAPSRPHAPAPPVHIAAAALQGEPAAMARVAEGYLAQNDVASFRQALSWLERAAAAGHAGAAGEVGQAYAAGHGAPLDAERAVAWWRYGAALGDARSMACLSAAYLLGRGAETDVIEAARWALLREGKTRGRSLLRPTAAEFERALPAAEMLEARRRAAETLAIAFKPVQLPRMSLAPAAMPEASAAVSAPMPLATPDGTTSVLTPSTADPPAPTWPAAWGAQPVTLPRPPQPGSSAGIGTGVVIARPGVLLTAAHVVRGCTDIEVQAGLARLGGAEVRVTNARLDLALVVVPGLERTPLPVAGETRLGAEVAVMGFPGQSLQTGRPVVTIGNVSAIGPGKAEDIMQFSAPVQAGNSGGPLLDRQGRVVGIAIMSRDALRDLLAGLNIPQNVNFAVAPDSIARFLADHGVPQTPATPGAPDFAALVEQVERSIVRIVCHRGRPVGGNGGSPGVNINAAR